MNDLYEKVIQIQQILIARATHQHTDEDKNKFIRLRAEVIAKNHLDAYIPQILRTSRTLEAFWEQIKAEFNHYAERKKIPIC